MSQENVEIARQSLTVAPHSRRRLEERLGLRFPGVLALVDRLVWRLPPRSRLRRAAFGRAARLALEAHNRGDFEAAVARYDSQVELISTRDSYSSATTPCTAVGTSAFASSSAGPLSGATSSSRHESSCTSATIAAGHRPLDHGRVREARAGVAGTAGCIRTISTPPFAGTASCWSSPSTCW